MIKYLASRAHYIGDEMRRYGQCLRLYTQAYTPGLNQCTRFNHFPRLLWRIYERGVMMSFEFECTGDISRYITFFYI